MRNQPRAKKLRSTKQDQEIESVDWTHGHGFESHRFEIRRIKQLPLEARNAASLLTLQPRVTLARDAAVARGGQANEQQVNSDVVSALTLSPNPASEQSIVTGTVMLSRPAPAGGVLVSLTSDKGSVAQPTAASLTVPEGSSTTTFSIEAKEVSAVSFATITAKANVVGKSAKLHVHPK